MRHSLPQLAGLTRIIFYICLIQHPQREIFSSLLRCNYRIFASKGQGPEMHLLDTDSTDRPVASRRPAERIFGPANIPRSPRPSGSPTMDHLDALEAQSIYIFREAFARLKKLALLWSLGKDSNVMIWLARKAFFGRVPFPALHVDTGKKFPEMYAFRDRYGKEWELDLKIEPCPPLETIDPTLAAGGALRRAQDRRAEARARQIRLRRLDRRHSPRRRGDPRQGAGVLAARHRRRMGRARSAAGILGPVQRLAAAGRASAHSPDPALDRSRYLGLHAARKHPDHPALSRAKTASAIARWAMPTSPIRWRRPPPASRKS